MAQFGTLFLVATPIGNLEDITLRAIRVLGEVDLIAAEDTRRTLRLLNHLGIKKPLTSYHEHNKAHKGQYLIAQLMEGKNLALVSDAGSPGISDPGEDLVRLAIDSGVPVTMIPGPVAAVTGLVISGLPTGRFVFEGFLPMNKRARKDRIALLKEETRTVILYEAPHKLTHTLRELHEVLGDRGIVMARELTKLHEEVMRCTLSQAVERYSTQSPRGEFVLLLAGAPEQDVKGEPGWQQMSLHEHVNLYLKTGLEKKEAMRKVAEERGISRREVYNALLGEEESC